MYTVFYYLKYIGTQLKIISYPIAAESCIIIFPLNHNIILKRSIESVEKNELIRRGERHTNFSDTRYADQVPDYRQRCTSQACRKSLLSSLHSDCGLTLLPLEFLAFLCLEPSPNSFVTEENCLPAIVFTLPVDFPTNVINSYIPR